jgi:hypothetical protein
MNKFLKALVTSAAFVLLLLLIHYLHVHFLRVNVVFYAAIGDAIVAAALTGALLTSRRLFPSFTVLEKIQLVFIWLLAGYAFAISVPTVIDRSLSFYILEKLQQRGGGIELAKFEDVFTKEYIKEHRLVDVRITEQQQSGTIRIVNGCVRLTPRGERLATFSRLYRQHFLPKQRLLMGEYSADLTDPFREGRAAPDYLCR